MKLDNENREINTTFVFLGPLSDKRRENLVKDRMLHDFDRSLSTDRISAGLVYHFWIKKKI